MWPSGAGLWRPRSPRSCRPRRPCSRRWSGRPSASLKGSTRRRAEMSMPPPARKAREDSDGSGPAPRPALRRVQHRWLAINTRRVSTMEILPKLVVMHHPRGSAPEGGTDIPGEVDPGILRHFGDKGINQRPSRGLGIDGGEMRVGQEVGRTLRPCRCRSDRRRSDAFAAELDEVRHSLHHPQVALVLIVLIALDANGLDEPQISSRATIAAGPGRHG